MRIQHNIMAMNAYRNYTNNTSALSKNLEKLSSGYKINRAGDDAAGLAISEKMRAQITGLETAQKNAKDGISLVQTAEGALTEVHDMLNRMVELADQSANGTYDNEVDRANLQKEMEQLKSEINRIADSSNFNGIKLLNGNLSGTGATSAVSSITTDLATTAIDATKASYEGTNTGSISSDGKKLSYTISLDNGKSYTVELTYDKTNKKLVSADGKEYAAGSTSASVNEVADALSKELTNKLGSDFKVTVAAAKITFEAKQAGTSAPKVTGWSQTTDGGTNTGIGITTTAADDAKTAIASSAFDEYDGTDNTVYTINGKKFAFGTAGTDFSKLGKDVNVILADPTADQDGIATELSQALGMTVTHNGNNYEFSAGTSTSGTGGLTLQIGDTSDSYNQLTVQVQDMHTKSLGIDGIDIGTQQGAQTAVQMIKDAINTVSSVRGDLGATQNRLDHTINNLSVMTENIQDAESTIRDTDVADEMMAYTKNNILVQSAQAMLAQANQVPQGVLQLLQ